MEKQEKLFVENFAKINSFDGSNKIRIIKDENGKEVGFELKGQLTEFGVRNANGYKFDPSSYDRFIEEYLQPNHFNIPVNIKHNDRDFQHVAGKVTMLEKTDNGVSITVMIPSWAYAYNWMKNAVNDGVLQAFSNFGPITEGNYEEGTNTINVKSFDIFHVALVELPGDVTSKFQTQNTIFKGFEIKQTRTETEESVNVTATEEPIDNEVNDKSWQW